MQLTKVENMLERKKESKMKSNTYMERNITSQNRRDKLRIVHLIRNQKKVQMTFIIFIIIFR